MIALENGLERRKKKMFLIMILKDRVLYVIGKVLVISGVNSC